jgi:hypothetical protein
MPPEETVASAEQVMAPVPDKGKKIADASLEENDFELRNLIDQELSEAEKKELQEYDISCGTSQKPCSLAGSMKRPWDAFATVPGRR